MWVEKLWVLWLAHSLLLGGLTTPSLSLETTTMATTSCKTHNVYAVWGARYAKAHNFWAYAKCAGTTVFGSVWIPHLKKEPHPLTPGPPLPCCGIVIMISRPLKLWVACTRGLPLNKSLMPFSRGGDKKIPHKLFPCSLLYGRYGELFHFQVRH